MMNKSGLILGWDLLGERQTILPSKDSMIAGRQLRLEFSEVNAMVSVREFAAM